MFDRFTTKTRITDSRKIAGHLSVEISRATKYLLDCGPEVIVKVTKTHYCWSPLVQGGLEIPCVLEAKMNGYSVRNQVLLQKCLELVNDLYAECNNEEIVGFLMVSCRESEPKRTTPVSIKKGKNSKAKYKYTGS